MEMRGDLEGSSRRFSGKKGVIVSKKYYWTRKEERKLLELFKGGLTDPKSLAEKLGRTPGAIQKKLERLGVVVIKKSQKSKTTTSVPLSNGLLTHEQALLVLAGAIKKAGEPGLDKLEIMRLRILIDAAKTYDSVLEKFERWVEIEERMLEMGKKIEELEKAWQVKSRFSRVQT